MSLLPSLVPRECVDTITLGDDDKDEDEHTRATRGITNTVTQRHMVCYA